MKLGFNDYVLPLFVGVEVNLAGVSVESHLVVHAVRDGSADHGLPVPERLAEPDNEYIVQGNVSILVGGVLAAVEVVNYRLSRPRKSILQ